MNDHWIEAQERARREEGDNIVFTPDSQACIVGSLKHGWIILSAHHNLKLEAQTPQGVERVLEELELPSVGWH